MVQDGRQRLVAVLREQARRCAQLGSPLYGHLLARAAEDLSAGGPVLRVLAGHEDDPPSSALALRLLGSAHRLALQGDAPGYADHLPSTGGDGDAATAWSALRELLEERCEDVRAGLRTPPQTNEVGRAAGLLGGLLTAAATVGRAVAPSGEPVPVRLWEFGCSGGLNLLLDRFRYRGADGSARGTDSPVELDPAWDAAPPWWPREPALDVVERVGGDPDVVDPTTPEGALLLRSYVWADQPERAARLEAVLRVAAEVAVERRRSGASQLLADLQPRAGALTAVQHSVVWQYLPEQERAATQERLDALGAAATEEAPVAVVSLEPPEAGGGAAQEYLVAVTTWPGGRHRILGSAPAHGLPVRWHRG